MLKYIFFVGILCTAAADRRIPKQNSKDTSVNLAVETVLEFDKEIKETGFKILNKVKNFVGEIENVFEDKNISRRNTKRENKDHFTNFIVSLIQTLIKYKNNDLEYLVIIINSELKRERDSTSHDVTANSDFQNILADKFATVKNKPATEIRHYLKALANKLSEETYVNKEEKELLDIVNSMCNEESVTKFNKFIKDLEDYRLKTRKNMDLPQLVRTGLRSILYEPYHRLRVNLKSNVTSKLHKYLKSYYDLINVDSKYTTISQTVSQLTTPSENYIKKILDFSGLKQYFKRWVSDLRNTKSSTTEITYRPTTETPVPITRKANSDDDNDSTDDVKPKEKQKDSKHKTHFKKETTKLKKRGDRSSEETTTLRQVYLEKNLDLKYNPYTDDQSTSVIKRNKRIRTSSTTRRRHKKPHSERSVKQKRIQKQDSVTFDESKQKFDDIDSDSTDISKLTSKRGKSSKYTETSKRFGRTVLDEDFEPDSGSQKKNRHRKSKADLVEHRSKYQMRSDKRDSYGDRELYTFKPDLSNVIELVKNIGYSIDIKKEKDLDLFDQNRDVNSSRYRRERYRKDSSRTFRGRRKPIKTPEQDRDSLKPKLKISNNKPISRYNSQHNVRRQQYRRYDTEVPIMSQEALSVQEFGDVNHNRHDMKDNDHEVPLDDDSKVLERIEHLENELNIIKTHIENDTNVKDLISQIENGDESKAVDFDSNIKVKSINNDNFSSKRLYINERAITKQLPNLNQEVIESKYDLNGIQSKSNANNFLKQVTTREYNDANHGLKEGSQLYEDNKNENDSYSLNTATIKYSSYNSSVNNIKNTATNNQQKDIKTESRKVSNNGIVFRGRYDVSTSVPKAKEELKANDEIFKKIQETTSNILDSTTTPSKLMKGLIQEVGGQSNANIENKVHKSETEKNGKTMNSHLVLNLASTQSLINETLTG